MFTSPQVSSSRPLSSWCMISAVRSNTMINLQWTNTHFTQHSLFSEDNWWSTLTVAGMMLIRSDSGQLMLVSQQALAQAPHGTRVVTGQAPRIVTHKVCVAQNSCLTQENHTWVRNSVIMWNCEMSHLTNWLQVSAAAGGKNSEKVTVIRMAAPPSLQPAQLQTAVVKVTQLHLLSSPQYFSF